MIVAIVEFASLQMTDGPKKCKGNVALGKGADIGKISPRAATAEVCRLTIVRGLSNVVVFRSLLFEE